MPRHLRILSAAIALALATSCKGDTTTTPPVASVPNPQGISVLTQRNDNSRAGWNANEVALTTANVNVKQFGLLFTMGVDDQVYAQPLVVGKLAIGGAARNVVYVATVANTLYAFDGDNGTMLWHRTYTAPGMRPPRNTDMTGACGGGYTDFSGAIGIVGTPVIDTVAKAIYFVARSTNGAAWVQHLHAVSMLTGDELAGSPVAITASVAGTGDGSVNGTITFNAQKQNQRQALTLVNGVVYVTFSSHCDWGPYHGWVLGYDAATLQQRTVYNDTPGGSAGGVWESGTGMAADADGYLYDVSGNGTVGVPGNPADVTNRAESALKLGVSGSTLRVADFFTPADWPSMNADDLDYGGMGAMLIPGARLFLTGDKAGYLYLLDTDAMGGYTAGTNRVHQQLRLSTNSEMHAQPAYYGGSAKEFVYLWPENEPLRALPFDRAARTLDLSAARVAAARGPLGHNGAMLTVSSDGTKDGTGILWASHALTGDAEHDVSPGILHAFDASDITNELWNNQQDARRDGAGAYAKFATPTVANGHVYLPTFSNLIAVYGLR